MIRAENSIKNGKVESTNVHHIDLSMISDAPTKEEVFKNLINFSKKSTAIAWFATSDFDLKWLPVEFAENKTLINIMKIAIEWLYKNKLIIKPIGAISLTKIYELVFKDCIPVCHRALSDAVIEGCILRLLLKL